MTTAAVRGHGAAVPAVGAAAASVLAVAVGAGLAVDVRLGAALAFGALAIPIALLDLPLVIALWAALTVFSRDPAFGRATSAVGLVIVAAWLVHLQANRASIRAALHVHRRLVAFVGLLLIWLTLSLAWSRNGSAASTELFYWYVNAAVVVVLLTSLRTPRDVRLVVFAAVLSVAAAVALALAGVDFTAAQSAADADALNDGRLQGVIGDPNYMAAFIVPAVALCAALRALVAVETRVLLIPVAIVLLVGLAATSSRGGWLAAVAAFVTAVVVMRGQRPAVLGVGALVLVIGGLWFSSNPAALERVRSIREDRGSGREDIWLVARRVSADHPIGGVGLANFTVRSREYVRRPGTLQYVELIVDRPHVVHNTYLQMLAETGAVGLALFAAVLWSALGSAVRAARSFERAGERALARFSRRVVVAYIGLLTAAVFISLQATVTAWVLLMLGPILFGLAQTWNRAAPQAERP
jgi:O-antigen ligase